MNHKTLWSVWEALKATLVENKAQSSEFDNYLHTGGVAYGCRQQFSFSLERLHGRFTSKNLQVVICRLDSGLYELNSYFN
jgi:hypothetical protein